MPRFIGQNEQGDATIAPAGRAAGFGASQLGGAALGFGAGPLSFFGGAGISALLMSILGQPESPDIKARRANELFQIAQGLPPGQGDSEGRDQRGGRLQHALTNAFNAQTGGAGNLLNPALQGTQNAFRFNARQNRVQANRNNPFIQNFASRFAGNESGQRRLMARFGLNPGRLQGTRRGNAGG